MRNARIAAESQIYALCQHLRDEPVDEYGDRFDHFSVVLEELDLGRDLESILAELRAELRRQLATDVPS